MSDEKDKSIPTAGTWLVVLTFGPPIMFYRAWVVSWMWYWFAVPFGLPVIGAVHVFGLLGLWKLAAPPTPVTKSPDNSAEKVIAEGIATAMVATIGLALAYLASLHVG